MASKRFWQISAGRRAPTERRISASHARRAAPPGHAGSLKAPGGTVFVHNPAFVSLPQIAARLLRLAKIVSVGLRFGLDQMVLDGDSSGRLPRLWKVVFFWRRFDKPRAVRLRLALESLGPIFVKFGQMLSTRRDLLPPDLAQELSMLQDRVPPFPSEQAIALLETFYGRPVDRSVRCLRAHPGGFGIGRPGTFREVAGRHRGCGEDPASRHRTCHRP